MDAEIGRQTMKNNSWVDCEGFKNEIRSNLDLIYC